jgi:hypothetical protein
MVSDQVGAVKGNRRDSFELTPLDSGRMRSLSDVPGAGTAVPTVNPATVAIVGLGPKGLYCLERIVAEFAARPLPNGLRVAVFNRSSDFGSSPVYDPGQPEYLLVNNSVGEIDLWGVDEPAIAPRRGPDFLAWFSDEFPSEKPLTGDEYLSRAVVGRYLRHGFRRVLAHLPAGMSVSCHVGEVVDVEPRVGCYVVHLVDPDGGRSELAAAKVLLATGHAQTMPGVEERRDRDFAARHPGTSYVPFAYPVAALDEVPTGARVAMKGIGLTFVDAVLAVTEGRGGTFERDDDGRLSYRAGGQEPATIIPFSRTGLPMAPKPFDQPQTLRPLTYVTPAVLHGLRYRAPGGKIDLERDLWPLVELEMELQYYRVAMGGGAEREELEACGDDGRAMRRVVESYLRAHPDQDRFDHRPVLDPVGGRSFADGAQFDSFVGRYMDQEIARARLGLAGSAEKAAIAIWYEVRTALSPFMAFGGLTPESHRRLMERYHHLLKRVVFGPPIVSIEKLRALHRARLLDFSVARAPEVVGDESTGSFELRCRATGATARAEVLVDARYPAVDVDHDASPLYRNLRRRGMVRPFENRSADATSAYRPGAIDMAEHSHHVVDERGTANEDIAVIGIPTEGNLLGNLSVTRDDFAGVWAGAVLHQLGGGGPE